MAGNNSLQILRGDASGVANNSNATLLDGQPFYNKTDNTIVVGDGQTELPDLEPLNSSDAKNVTASIGGKPISSIFETNGTTVKNATSASQDGSGKNIVNTYATKTELSSETFAREAADDTLTQQISTETSNRQSADNALSQQIEEETSARTSTDNTLRSSIDKIINGTTVVGSATEASNYTDNGTIASKFSDISTSIREPWSISNSGFDNLVSSLVLVWILVKATPYTIRLDITLTQGTLYFIGRVSDTTHDIIINGGVGIYGAGGESVYVAFNIVIGSANITVQYIGSNNSVQSQEISGANVEEWNLSILK